MNFVILDFLIFSISFYLSILSHLIVAMGTTLDILWEYFPEDEFNLRFSAYTVCKYEIIGWVSFFLFPAINHIVISELFVLLLRLWGRGLLWLKFHFKIGYAPVRIVISLFSFIPTVMIIYLNKQQNLAILTCLFFKGFFQSKVFEDLGEILESCRAGSSGSFTCYNSFFQPK